MFNRKLKSVKFDYGPLNILHDTIYKCVFRSVSNYSKFDLGMLMKFVID